MCRLRQTIVKALKLNLIAPNPIKPSKLNPINFKNSIRVYLRSRPFQVLSRGNIRRDRENRLILRVHTRSTDLLRSLK